MVVKPFSFFTDKGTGKVRPLFSKRPKSIIGTPVAEAKKRILPTRSSMISQQATDLARRGASFARRKAEEYQEEKKIEQQQKEEQARESQPTKTAEEIAQQERTKISESRTFNKGRGDVKFQNPVNPNEEPEVVVGRVDGRQVTNRGNFIRPEQTAEETTKSEKRRSQAQEDRVRLKLLETSSGRTALGIDLKR